VGVKVFLWVAYCNQQGWLRLFSKITVRVIIIVVVKVIVVVKIIMVITVNMVIWLFGYYDYCG
jgi:hypothetical protein